MSQDRLREALEAVKPFEKLFADAELMGKSSKTNIDAQIAMADLRRLVYAAADAREVLAASKPEPQAQAAEHEVWRFGFVGAAFVFMKDGPYVLLEQIKKHHREDIAKRDAALDACAEALKYAQFYSNKQHVIEKMNAAITKAQEARKS